MLVDEFDFVLPKDLIADVPVYPRDKSRLLQVKNLEDKFMDDFPSLLQAGDVLVFNDTKVIPARISGTKGTAKVEVTLHMEIANGIWKAFAKPARKLKLNDKFFVADDFSAVVIDKKDAEVILNFSINTDEFYQKLDKYGKMPLPPYIDRKNIISQTDNDDYQTIYAKNKGAVAAPTAGLHFTENLLNKISKKGVRFVFTTLHVGAGTFLPVKVDDTKDHKMHSE